MSKSFLDGIGDFFSSAAGAFTQPKGTSAANGTEPNFLGDLVLASAPSVLSGFGSGLGASATADSNLASTQLLVDQRAQEASDKLEFLRDKLSATVAEGAKDRGLKKKLKKQELIQNAFFKLANAAQQGRLAESNALTNFASLTQGPLLRVGQGQGGRF